MKTSSSFMIHGVGIDTFRYPAYRIHLGELDQRAAAQGFYGNLGTVIFPRLRVHEDFVYSLKATGNLMITNIVHESWPHNHSLWSIEVRGNMADLAHKKDKFYNSDSR